MIVLALDTATTDLVTGLVTTDASNEHPQLIDESITATRAHNEQLVPTVVALLDRTHISFGDLDAVVVGSGPGPFTGLRVGMASASAFGQALGIPVYGVVTHDAVAHTLGSDCLVVTDARRREVYWATYRNGQRVAGPSVTTPADVDADGIGTISVPEHLVDQLPAAPHARITYAAPHPLGLVAAADVGREPGPLVPHYLRRPDAKVPAATVTSPAIPHVDVEDV